VADPNQTPQRGNWVCPCNGCKKAAKQEFDRVVNIVQEYYESCWAVKDGVCEFWWKHENCEAIRELLNILMDDEKYKSPKEKPKPGTRPSVNE